LPSPAGPFSAGLAVGWFLLPGETLRYAGHPVKKPRERATKDLQTGAYRGTPTPPAALSATVRPQVGEELEGSLDASRTRPVRPESSAFGAAAQTIHFQLSCASEAL